MTRLGYLVYFVTFFIVNVAINFLFFDKEINRKLFLQTLLITALSIIFIYVFQKIRK